MNQDKSALIVLGTGFEELEALGPIDLLRRAGVAVTVASREAALEVTGRNGVTLVCEVDLGLVAARVGGGERFDCVIVPGGPGVVAMRGDTRVKTLLATHHGEGKLVAAICAAPLVLHDAGVLAGRRYTGHASIASELPDLDTDSAVVVDRAVMTSRGAGTAVDFGLALVEALVDAETARGIAEAIHFSR